MLIKGELRFIEILGRVKEINSGKLEEVKEQLIRGDKFEMIYRDLVKFNNQDNTNFILPNEYRGYQGGVLRYLLKVLHDKYFPVPRTEHTPFTKGFKEGMELGKRLGELNSKVQGLIRG